MAVVAVAMVVLLVVDVIDLTFGCLRVAADVIRHK